MRHPFYFERKFYFIGLDINSNQQQNQNKALQFKKSIFIIKNQAKQYFFDKNNDFIGLNVRIYQLQQLKMHRNIKKNKIHKKPSQKDEPQQYYLSVDEFPQHIHQLIIQNKRMAKKIQILQTQIDEKNRVISQLKDQLDDGIVESTQNKLSYCRTIQDKMTVKIDSMKEDFQQRILCLEEQLRMKDKKIQIIYVQMQQTQKENQHLVSKLKQMKQYIIDIIDEKDYLISELGAIITEQQSNVLKISNHQFQKEPNMKYYSKTDKKVAFIKRNQ